MNAQTIIINLKLSNMNIINKQYLKLLATGKIQMGGGNIPVENIKCLELKRQVSIENKILAFKNLLKN